MLNKKDVETFTKGFLEEVLTYLKEYDKRLEGMTCNIKMDWSTRRVASRAGTYANGPGISLAMYTIVKEKTSKDNPQLFSEYASYEKDTIIGEFLSHTWQLCMMGDITHEVAHIVCDFLKINTVHGAPFKKWYAILRKKFINLHIPVVKKTIIRKVSAKETQEQEQERSIKRADFFKYCKTEGLDFSYFHAHRSYKGRDYRVVGWNPRARKNFIFLEREDGKIFVDTPKNVKDTFEKCT